MPEPPHDQRLNRDDNRKAAGPGHNRIPGEQGDEVEES